MKLCSACLLGVKCRYDGKSRESEKVIELAKTEVLIPVCPEILGGLSTPRNPVELKNGKVVDESGIELTDIYRAGVEEAIKLTTIYKIDGAILKQNSPTCGSGQIYDGSFTGKKIAGDGLFTKELKMKGIKVISEEEL